MARTLINAPKTAQRGDTIEIRALISHPMETGYRAGSDGRLYPRDIITGFVCRYDGAEVFSAEFSPAMAANPYIVFTTVATTSGTLSLTWTGDNGFEQTEALTLTVT